MSEEAAKSLVQAFISSRLDYCNTEDGPRYSQGRSRGGGQVGHGPRPPNRRLSGFLGELALLERRAANMPKIWTPLFGEVKSGGGRRPKKVVNFCEKKCTLAASVSPVYNAGYARGYSAVYRIVDNLHQRLQSTQNAAAVARLVTRASRCEHITPVLREIQRLPVRRRVEFKLASLVFKTLYVACWHRRVCQMNAS